MKLSYQPKTKCYYFEIQTEKDKFYSRYFFKPSLKISFWDKRKQKINDKKCVDLFFLTGEILEIKNNVLSVVLKTELFKNLIHNFKIEVASKFKLSNLSLSPFQKKILKKIKNYGLNGPILFIIFEIGEILFFKFFENELSFVNSFYFSLKQKTKDLRSRFSAFFSLVQNLKKQFASLYFLGKKQVFSILKTYLSFLNSEKLFYSDFEGRAAIEDFIFNSSTFFKNNYFLEEKLAFKSLERCLLKNKILKKEGLLVSEYSTLFLTSAFYTEEQEFIEEELSSKKDFFFFSSFSTEGALIDKLGGIIGINSKDI